jgi:hypothetical protein
MLIYTDMSSVIADRCDLILAIARCTGLNPKGSATHHNLPLSWFRGTLAEIQSASSAFTFWTGAAIANV